MAHRVGSLTTLGAAKLIAAAHVLELLEPPVLLAIIGLL